MHGAARDSSVGHAGGDRRGSDAAQHRDLNEIAARARAGKSTLYHRWPSKTELVFDAIRALNEQLTAAATPAPPPPGPGTLRGDIDSVLKDVVEPVSAVAKAGEREAAESAGAAELAGVAKAAETPDAVPGISVLRILASLATAACWPSHCSNPRDARPAPAICSPTCSSARHWCASWPARCPTGHFWTESSTRSCCRSVGRCSSRLCQDVVISGWIRSGQAAVERRVSQGRAEEAAIPAVVVRTARSRQSKP